MNKDQRMRVAKHKSAFAPMTLAKARALRDELGLAAFWDHCLERAQSAGDNAMIASANGPGDTADGPLAGLPFAVKDNIDCAPFATTGGTPGLKNYQPQQDATTVADLKKAGGYVGFKTNMHELAFGITSNNAAFGPVRNPFDPARSAGGSSGGNAAAIAQGVVPFALGTDTGGSTRIPAAFCGIAGFRPSTGRYANAGMLLLSTTRDTAGPMAVNCGDLAEIDALITGDVGTPDIPERLRIGVMGMATGTCQAVDDALAQSMRALERSGLVELINLEAFGFEALEASLGRILVAGEARDLMDDFCRANLDITLPDLAAEIASPDVRRVFEKLLAAPAGKSADYTNAILIKRPELIAAYAATFAEASLDLIMRPTVTVQPPMIGEDELMETDQGPLPTFPTVATNTGLASIVGAPSLAIPAGRDGDGLPVSLMFEGLPGTDRFVLCAGILMETHLST